MCQAASGSVSSRNPTPGSFMSAADRGTSDTPSPAPTSDKTVNSSFAPARYAGRTRPRTIIDVDYLIDDRARHFERFKGHPLLFSAPHNAAESRYPRVDSWNDVREVFARLERREKPVWQTRGVVEPAAAIW